jgi:hypothetical protein
MNKLLQSNFTNLDFEVGSLTKIVHRSHKICFLGYAYHPYHIAMDAGNLALLIFSYWWVYRQPQISFLAFFGVFGRFSKYAGRVLHHPFFEAARLGSY